MSTNSTPTSTSSRGSAVTAGIILILAGLTAFAANFIKPDGALFIGVLALIFLAAGMVRRSNGLLVPGGVLAGLAGGIYLTQNIFHNATDPFTGGMFLLAFAAGWVLITLLSTALYVFDQKHHVMLWPLIPASILALTGGMLITNNTTALDLLNKGWPLVLVIIGASILLRRGNSEK